MQLTKVGDLYGYECLRCDEPLLGKDGAPLLLGREIEIMAMVELTWHPTLAGYMCPKCWKEFSLEEAIELAAQFREKIVRKEAENE